MSQASSEMIATAGHAQTKGIEQVNQAVAQIDQTTQQNAALAEQAVTAADASDKKAGELTQAVNVFK